MSSAVPEGWQVSPLGSLATVNWGNLSLTKDSYVETGFPAYSAAGNDGLVPNAEHTAVGVVLSAIGARCGRTFLTPQRWTAIKNTITILSDNQDIRFLYQVFNFNEVWNKSGGAQPFISLGDARKTPILHPPLPEQKKIASILTSVDEVIENTQKQIDKLQDLKKATMNELLTKGIGHTEFKDSELGRIPKSWEVRSLSEVSELSRGKFSHRPRNDPAFYDGDFPFLQTGDIPTDNLDIAYFSQSLNEKGLQVSRLFPKGTLVMTIAATVGEVAFLTFDSCFPDSLVGITANESLVRQYFLLFCLRFRKQVLIQEAPESAQKNLNLDILNPFQVAVPPLHEQRAIESTLLSIQKHIEKNKTKLSQTQSLKKSLMQDLLTGKVRVTVN
jgi:type I restriction enzyme S subunit